VGGTDSDRFGRFSGFSLSKIRKITENGVIFRSPRDGQTIDLTPERSIEIQNALGADVIMAFDECPPHPANREEIQASTARTYRWLERCIAAHQRTDHCLELCRGVYLICAPMLPSPWLLDLPGYAIGGVSGRTPELIAKIVRATAPLLP